MRIASSSAEMAREEAAARAKEVGATLPFWVWLSTRLMFWWPPAVLNALGGAMVLCGYVAFVEAEVLTRAVAVTACTGFFAAIVMTSRMWATVRDRRLLLELIECLSDSEAVAQAASSVNKEARLHVFNGVLPLAVGALVTRTMLAAGKNLAVIAAAVAFGLVWWLYHTFLVWGIISVQRLCCKLLELVAVRHLDEVQRTLRDVGAPVEARLSRLSSAQRRVERLFIDANAAFTVPNLVIGFTFVIMLLSVVLELLGRAGQGQFSLSEKAVPVALAALCVVAIALLLHGLAAVGDAYEAAASRIPHSIDLINHSEELFPGNGTAFLGLLQTDMALGFELNRVRFDGRLVLSVVSSLAAAVLLTLLLGAVG